MKFIHPDILQNEKQETAWMVQNLREQSELLQVMLLYYRSVEHSAEHQLTLATTFKVSGFLWPL